MTIPARSYHPDEEPGAPLVVYFHGGGWLLGSVESHDTVCRSLANASGAVVVNVGYRCAPESRFPTAVEDAWAATAWAQRNAEGLGADGTRLAVAGDSAGGNLAAVIAQLASDAGGPEVRFQLLVYPITAADLEIGFDMEPPTQIQSAECDPLHWQAELYRDHLQQAGVDVEYHVYDGMIHGYFGVDSRFPDRTPSDGRCRNRVAKRSRPKLIWRSCGRRHHVVDV